MISDHLSHLDGDLLISLPKSNEACITHSTVNKGYLFHHSKDTMFKKDADRTNADKFVLEFFWNILLCKNCGYSIHLNECNALIFRVESIIYSYTKSRSASLQRRTLKEHFCVSCHTVEIFLLLSNIVVMQVWLRKWATENPEVFLLGIVWFSLRSH